MDCTLVTALIDIDRGQLPGPEQRSMETYFHWMELVLSNPSPLVIYLSPHLEGRVRQLRGDRPMQVVRVTRNELIDDKIYPRIVDLISEPKPRPDRPECQIPLYNAVMFKKTQWLAKVALDNPFHSKYFLWIDVGYGHGRSLIQPYLQSEWPSKLSVLDDHKIHILQVHPVPRLTETQRFHAHRTFLGGGCFGGSARAVRRLGVEYQSTLLRTLDEGLMDDDQAVMASLYLEDPSLFRLVGPTYGNYFEMLPYLAGKRWKSSAKGFLQDHPWTVGVLLGSTLAAYALWARRKRHKNFGGFYRRAILDVCEVLESIDATYWFTEGTLIALLRYGSNEPEVDDDIDVMIEARDQSHWESQANLVIEGLVARGWSKGKIYSTFLKEPSRADKMQAKIKSQGCRTHVDLHSYFVDEERGLAYSHGHPEAYPFQHWQGFVPTKLIYPLKRCLCYDRAAPCPNQPFELLRHWHGDEYGDSPLCFPPGPVSKVVEQEIWKRARELDKAGFASMTPELES